jgi:hypothetical protein
MFDLPTPAKVGAIFTGEFLTNAECEELYYRIIEHAKSRVLNKSIHESHHILPKSLGGSNKKFNRACLYYDEHFFVHVLLTRIYEKEPDQFIKMLNSLGGVVCKNGLQAARDPKIWQIDLAKTALAIKMQGNTYLTGHRWSLTKDQCSKISDRLIGNQYGLGNQNAKGRNLLSENGRAKAVRCLDDGEVYGTIKEAAQQYGVNGGKIGMVCIGARPHTGGLRFEFV